MSVPRCTWSLKALLLSATLLAAPGFVQADMGDGGLDNTGQAPLPSRQYITPSFATGAVVAALSTNIPEYTAAISNHGSSRAHGAMASTRRSPVKAVRTTPDLPGLEHLNLSSA